MNQRNPEPSDGRDANDMRDTRAAGPNPHTHTTRWAVDVRREAETAHGWSWDVWLHPADDGNPELRLPEPRSLRVSMSWVDHDHLCHGRMSPSEVVTRILRHTLAQLPASTLPARLDVSSISRLIATQGGAKVPSPAAKDDDVYGTPDPSDLSRLFDTVG